MVVIALQTFCEASYKLKGILFDISFVQYITAKSRSTIVEAGMSQICPRFGGDGTEISPPRDLLDQPPGEMSWFGASLPTI